MNDYDGTPLSLVEYTEKLIAQFLHEQGHEKTLQAFTEETEKNYPYLVHPESGLSGTLLNVVRRYSDKVIAASLEGKTKKLPKSLKVSSRSRSLFLYFVILP
jgi:hypothetical protein